jgi:putative tryptophan/tyrosine transport system substrate-binding protein
MIKRRQFVTMLGSTALCLGPTAWAQSSRKPVIGVLFHSNPDPNITLLRSALRDLGHIEGETIQLDVRVADSSNARLAEMAADLAARKVDVIVASTTPAVVAAKAATASIPIVMAGVADPVGSGLVASLARPGGNITGNSSAVAEVAGKLLGLLREAVPSAARIGMLANAADPFHVRLIEQIDVANRSVKIDLRIFKVSGPGEIAAAFAAMAAARIDAAIIQPTLPRKDVISHAFKQRLPTASPILGFAQDGGLLSYSGNFVEQFKLAASYVDKILKGAKPADLPVVQPTKFEMVLNLKTAKELGVAISPLLLAQADEVIE